MNDFNIEETLSSDFTNISKDMLEVGVDSILDDGLLKDIPIFGCLISLSKIGVNIKDRLFIKKLSHFLYETQRVPKNKRERVIKKINKSKQFQSNVGEKIIFILDRADDILKAKLIGKLFSYVLEEKLDYKMYNRCVNSINRSFEPDLKSFLEVQHSEFEESIEKDGLISSGLLKAESAEGAIFLGGGKFDLKYKVSEVGECIRKYLGNTIES